MPNSIAVKVSIALSLVIVALISSYIVMNTRLNAIQSSIFKVTEISNNTVGILKVNKEIIEIQRDLSVFGSTGSEAIFTKIEDNHQDIVDYLSSLNSASVDIAQEHLNSMSELVQRYGKSLASLKARYAYRKQLQERLPELYQSALDRLYSLDQMYNDDNTRLYINSAINNWHLLHRDAEQFLTKKDFKKRQSVTTTIQILASFKEKFPANVLSQHRSHFESLEILVNEYSKTFKKSIQANRNYLSLVNVVMAGDAIEFSNLVNSLREESLNKLEQIRQQANNTVAHTNDILKLLGVAAAFYVVMIAVFFHIHISKPIRRLTTSFERFHQGDLSAAITDTHRKDEIGVLANSANQFRLLSSDLAAAKSKAENITKIKSEFLANMSHEIRTPMNGILGMSKQLETTELTAEQLKMLNIIRSSGKSLLVIVNDILDLSKIEAGKIELESEPVNLAMMLEEIHHLFVSQAKEKGIELYVSLPDDHDVLFIVGDETRLKQILINLVGNAIKFTEYGSVSVIVDVEAFSEDELKLTFKITDTGIGIAKESIENLFEAFSQADTSITRKFGGTGLGLTITSKLLSLMGSRLQVDSEFGHGSVFYFELITAKAEEKRINTAPSETAYFDEVNYSELSVLVVEDNKVNQLVIEAFLGQLGVKNISVAEDGEEAIEKCESALFDIIFMDMQMPKMDGPTATINIKSFAGYKETPIIALTANVLKADQERCKEAGMCDFLTKPIEIEALSKALKHWAMQN